jgi:hypothetical protein
MLPVKVRSLGEGDEKLHRNFGPEVSVSFGQFRASFRKADKKSCAARSAGRRAMRNSTPTEWYRSQRESQGRRHSTQPSDGIQAPRRMGTAPDCHSCWDLHSYTNGLTGT